jgi:hypothetical protein
MIPPLLSILIPTTIGREAEFGKLRSEIEHQKNLLGMGFSFNPISVLYAVDNKEMTIGEKREWLYHNSPGQYSWQIDDDDTIPLGAISKILYNITKHPDCITFMEYCTINGSVFSSNHSLKYQDWGEHQDGFDYVRTPFFKSVIKTEIAKSVPVPHIRFGEDHQWARLLKPCLNNEIHIDEYLYYYQHNSKPEDHNTRYGITQ